jgi:NTP pyrophosphatase (non-canonical NTP hydrolase)
MNLNEYQKESSKTRVAKYEPGYIYTALGLAGEAGEVADKIKKILRDNEAVVSEERRQELKKELGDVLWYVAQLSLDLGFDLDDIAITNLTKLRSRYERGEIKGDGDNR